MSKIIVKDESYNKGLSDAWDIAFELINEDEETLVKLFGTDEVDEIISLNEPQEVMAKFRGKAKMIEQEAIEVIKKHIRECEHRVEIIQDFMENNATANLAKCAENIEILNIAIVALEKQVPMKPKRIIPVFGRSYECAYCGNELEVNSFNGQYCHWCGQKLDFGE